MKWVHSVIEEYRHCEYRKLHIIISYVCGHIHPSLAVCVYVCKRAPKKVIPVSLHLSPQIKGKHVCIISIID